MQKVVFNSDGSLWAVLLKQPRVASQNSDSDDLTAQLIKIINTGRLDSSLGNKGFVSTKLEYPNMRVDALVQTLGGGVALVLSGNLNSPAGVSTYEPPIWIYRFNQKGQLEPEQKTQGFEALTCTNGGDVEYFGVRPDNTAVLMNRNSGDCSGALSIWSLDSKNSVLSEFGRELPSSDGTFPPFAAALTQSSGGRIWLSRFDKAVLWSDGGLLLHGATASLIQIQKITQSGALGFQKEIANPFKGYTLLESENKILLVGLENGAWSLKKLAF